MTRIRDLSGQRFGKLTALRPLAKHEVPHDRTLCHIFWLCRCDCGREHIVARPNLTCGATRSCGQCGASFADRQQTIEKIRRARLAWWKRNPGYRHTEETKRKISAAMRRRA